MHPSPRDLAPPPQLGADLELRLRVETFLYEEARLLDEWRLDEWLTMLEPDVRYMIPAPDFPQADPAQDTLIVHDNLFLLKERVRQFKAGTAYSESPQSLTTRIVSNVLAHRSGDDTIEVAANFVVFREKRARVDTFRGYYEHLLVERDGAFRFRRRKAVLRMGSLRSAGKLSVIL